ncbi:MAG: TonB family protein [Gammaproteobacteria bacterium]|nr:TonB family protein [Gammaproteobacteria bacterium]
MTQASTWNEPFLPWVESENDRRFKRILLVTVILFLIFGMIIPLLPVPEPEQKELKDVAPRLAKLILEKKKQPPPPPPLPKTRKKLVKKKAEPKKKPTQKQQAARKVAQSTGLVALSDELADLRDTFNLASLEAKPLKKVGPKQTQTTKKSSLLEQKAKQSSGGINTQKLTKSTTGSQLASRNTTNVTSDLASKTLTSRSAGRNHARGEEEIERIFQKNKGAIFGLYNRALRKDPGLQGKVVLELTIAPDGSVIKCRIISSELNNPKLEKRLIARVKLFKFAAKDVSQTTITYPVDFLPS